MIIVASDNGAIGLPEAIQLLQSGSPALDVVESAVRAVESNPEDHSVGLGGLPNLLGEVELDASIMDGRTLRAGAVGSLRGYEHPISVARKVMEELPHVLIVGEGADRFASEMGFSRTELLTPEARRIWREKLEDSIGPRATDELRQRSEIRELARLATNPLEAHETVNVLVVDKQGFIAGGVSTSGWAWKYPGRLGDSPVIGAGCYADNRYGAAACTGRGEMAIRQSTARTVVLYMKMGLSVDEACVEAMKEFEILDADSLGELSIRAIDSDGNAAGVCNRADHFFWQWHEGLDEPARVPLIHIDIG
jgi:beta-aspartyl-peptidase (threonine type)